MYSFFYPENNVRCSTASEHVFKTKKEAVDYWKDRRPIWQDITAMGGEPSFLQPNTGEVIVVREI